MGGRGPFSGGTARLGTFGVTMVRDVAPFEEMKLRLLNGAHSAIAYLGLLLGHGTVARSFRRPAIRRFVARLWAEAIPTLPADAGLDPQAYTRRTDAALRQPGAGAPHRADRHRRQPEAAAAHRRLGPGAAGRPAARPDHLIAGPAAWIAACEARGDTLPAGHFTDPLDAPLDEICSPNA